MFTYNITQSRPDNAVRAYRDSLVESLEKIIAIQRDNALSATRVRDSARVAGRIEQLMALQQLLKATVIS